MIIYVVTMYAVYDQGLGGVFSTREAAEDHAKALAADSDGHHDFRIDELRIDSPIWTDCRWESWNKERVQKRVPDITFFSYEES